MVYTSDHGRSTQLLDVGLESSINLVTLRKGEVVTRFAQVNLQTDHSHSPKQFVNFAECDCLCTYLQKWTLWLSGRSRSFAKGECSGYCSSSLVPLDLPLVRDVAVAKYCTIRKCTIFSDGYLGSHTCEGRSEVRSSL